MLCPSSGQHTPALISAPPKCHPFLLVGYYALAVHIPPQSYSRLPPNQFFDIRPTKTTWQALHGKAAATGPDTTSRGHSQSATDTAECGTQPGSDSGNSAGSGRRNSCQFLLFLRIASRDHIPASHQCIQNLSTTRSMKSTDLGSTEFT